MKNKYSLRAKYFGLGILLTVALLALIPPQTIAQISGTKVIGAGGDYATFAAAVTALGTGVSGPVVFNVKPGTYTEQISIGTVTGASATNTITFQAQTGIASDVILTFTPTSTNNYVVNLNGADYVTFQKMTLRAQGSTSYGVVFQLFGDANHNKILDNLLTGVSTTSYTPNLAIINAPNQAVDDLVIKRNTFTNGGIGVELTGVNSVTLMTGIQIDTNTFDASYGAISIQNASSPLIRGNIINNPGVRGIEMTTCNNDFIVSKNKITGLGTGYGIYLNSSDGGGTSGLIANNFIQCSGGNGAIGIYLTSASNENVFYNSVNMTGGATNSTALYVQYGAGNVNIENNILANPGGGYATNVYTPASLGTSDYNDFYTTGNYLAVWANVGAIDLAALKTASSKEVNSLAYNPNFTTATNLHTNSSWLDGKGVSLAEVSDDIDGDARNGTTPDIGADEYTSSAGAPLAGTYTIGATGTYPSFTAAVADLELRGVSGAVTFNVQTAIYTEHVILTPVPGSSAANTITFQALTNNAANVTLAFAATAPESNYVVILYGADNIRFHKMTFRANQSAGASYGTIFYMAGNVDKFTLDSTVLRGVPVSNNSSNYSVVWCNGALTRNMTINGNTFNDGGYAIYLGGLGSTSLSTGTQVTGNTFNNPDYTGIYMDYQDTPVITANTIVNPASRGMEVDYCANDLIIAKNKISGVGSYGIYLNSCTGGGNNSLIANNFIQVSGGNGAVGIYLSSVSNQNVFYNSVNMTGGATTSTALYVQYGAGNVNIENNILANPGGGYATNVYTPASLATSDYNDFYSTGNYLAVWANAGVIDLAALKTASSKEVNSLAYNPNFTTATNLHTNTPWLDGKGVSVAEVSDDIDGDARDGTTPDIGADEYTSSVGAPLAGSYTIGATGTYPSFTAAVADLELRGVSGAVTFNVQTGIYTEHVIMTPVPGSSAANTITFQALTNNAANVTLAFAATAPESNYVVILYGADNIRFHKMTFRANQSAGASYGTIFYMAGNVDGFTLDSTVLRGVPVSNNSSNYSVVWCNGALMRNTTINGNTFNDGGYAVYLGGLGSTSLSTGTHITGNTFNNPDYTGMYMDYQDAPVITMNTILNPASRGMELYYCANDLVIAKNKITGAGSYGIFLNTCTGGGNNGLIANNFIQVVGGNGAYGLYISSTSNENIFYNSVNMTGGATSSSAIQVQYGAGNVNIENNILANPGGGYATYIYTPGALGTSDYNDFYTTGNYLAVWVNTGEIDLAALQTASSKEVNSLAYNPNYLSATNLHTNSSWLDGKGVSLAEVSDDIDGDARDGSTPDIGADEYTSNAGAPLAGTYTIGATGTYPSFTAAVADLELRGVSGAVTFNVQTAIYTEHVILTPVPGSSAANTITFQALTNNAANVTLAFAATAPESNYVVILNGADNIRFHKMTFRANQSAGAGYGTIFYMVGNVDRFTLDSTVLRGVPVSNSSGNYTVVYVNGALTRNMTVNGNTFNDGGYALVVAGLGSASNSTGTQVTGNTFNNQDYESIYMSYQDAPVITMNTIVSPANEGMEFNYCVNGMMITKNRISGVVSYYGMTVNSCNGGGTSGLIANNFIQCSGGNSAVGIYITSSSNQNIFFNSVNMTGAATTSTGLYVQYGSGNVNVANNILANPGGGYATNVLTPASIDTTDNNDLYTAGATLAVWASAGQANLAALRTASSKEANSISADPAYFSATNLHTIAPVLDGAGAPLGSVVTDDIDGNPRNLLTPDIGAYEFSLTFNFSASVGTGWNMVSVPVTVADLRRTVLYPTSATKAFLFVSGAYQTKDTLKYGSGYWLKYAAPASEPMSGTARLRDTIAVTVGWNMIGGLTYPMPRTAIIQNPASIVKTSYYYYTSTGYKTADTLFPGVGYWVKIGAAGSLILDVNQTTAQPSVIARAPATENFAQYNTIAVEQTADGMVNTGTLYFTSADEQGAHLELYGIPPAPPAEVFDVRFASNRTVESFSVDGTTRNEIPFRIQGPGGKTRISWTMSRESNVRYAIIEQKAQGAIVKHPLGANGSVTLDVEAGDTYVLKTEGLPAEYALMQNYPNPFNPSTQIRFTLPERANVTLKIFNILGQAVATPLLNEPMEVGDHSVVVDAGNWVSGVYFYQLSAGSFTSVKKMTFLK